MSSDSDTGSAVVVISTMGFVFWIGLWLALAAIFVIVAGIVLGIAAICGLVFYLGNACLSPRGWFVWIIGTIILFSIPYAIMYFFVFGQSWDSVSIESLSGWQIPIPPLCFFGLFAAAYLSNRLKELCEVRLATTS